MQKPREFRVTVRIHNNLLIAKREALGLSPKEAAEKIGISYGTYCGYEALRDKPYSESRYRWTTAAKAIAKFYGVAMKELWPDMVRHVKKTKVVRELSTAEMHSLLGEHTQTRLLSNPEELFLEKEKIQAVRDAVHAVASPRMAAILLRPGTLQEAADEDVNGVGVERVRQIAAVGIRRLQNTSTGRRLREFAPNARE